MRKLITALLLCLALAGVSGAQEMSPLPAPNVYTCDYNFPVDNAENGGLSFFVFNVPGPSTLLRGIEYFEAVLPNGDEILDNRKVAFEFVRDVVQHKPDGPEIIATIWNFSKKPSGWSCRARVTGYGAEINVTNCTDGHARRCRRQ